MNRNKSALPPVEGVDLDFRPASYFWPMALETDLLARIKGAERQSMVRAMIEAGRLDEIDPLLAASALGSDERAAIGRWHPAFMGGEYLPDLGRHEVMIARITIASTTQDVTCVYARRGRNRIGYRVVDEYGGDTLCAPSTRTSRRPLTLGQLEAFFNGAWSIFEVLECNYGDDGYDLSEMLGFVEVESAFYPQIGKLYERRITSWAAGRQRS